jgi:hypothetical protein
MFHLNKIYFKRKKRKKESNYIRRRGCLQRSNAIKDGFVGRLCVYGGISLQGNFKGAVVAD